MVPAATEAEGETKSVEPEAVSVSGATHARVQLTAVSTPVKPVVERTVQRGKRLGNCLKNIRWVSLLVELNQAKSHPSAKAARARLLVENRVEVGG